MKKLSYFLLATLVCFSLSFVSCSDDPTGDPPPPSTPPVDNSEILSFPFSTLSPEAQKEKIATEANAFLGAMNDMPSGNCLSVLKAFNNLLLIAEPNGLDGLGSSEDIIYIKDFYGKYTWNAQKRKWDTAENSSQLEFNFPVGEKTAKISITGVASDVNVEMFGDEYYDYYEGERVEESQKIQLPKELTAKIYLANQEVGSINAKSNIVDDKTAPSLTEVKYVMDDYTLTMVAAKKTPNVATATLKKGSRVLIDATADLTANVDNAINDKDPGAMKGNLIIRIMDNLAIAGNIDVDKYIDAMNKADEIYDQNKPGEELDKEYCEASAKAFNNNTNLYIASLSERAKFAKIIEGVKEYTESYWDYDWDYQYDWYTRKYLYYENDQWVAYDYPQTKLYTYTYWDSAIYFEFKDGSKSEIEAYFSEGFEIFMENMMKFLREFQ